MTEVADQSYVGTAVTRLGYEGKVHGPGEAISVERAMRAVTIDAAYTLEKEKEYGSIESGKVADFAILEESPFDVKPEKIKDIKVWGTVLGGKKDVGSRPREPRDSHRS